MRAGDPLLGPDHVALGRRIGEHEPAGGVGAVGLHDVARVDGVPLRLRHLLDGADLDRLAGGGIDRLAAAAILADLHLGRARPAAVAAAIGLVHDHALGEQAGERLVDAEMAGRLHRAGEEARIEEVQDGVLDAADILVDRQPAVGGAPVGRGRRRAGAVKRAKYQDESTKVSMVSVSRVAAPPHFGQATCFQVGWWSSGLPGLSKVTSSGRTTGRSFFGNRDDAVGRAVDDRDRAAPVALARDAPVAQAVVHLAGALRRAASSVASRRRATSSLAASTVMPSRKSELNIVPSPS